MSNWERRKSDKVSVDRGNHRWVKLLSKVLSILLVVMCLGDVRVRASGMEPNEQYAKALESVKKVIDIANNNNIKPFYYKCENSLDPGKSDIDDILAGQKEGLYTEISKARENIKLISDDFIDYKNIFSSILSNYEYAIYDCVNGLISDNENNPKQADIILARTIIKDFETKDKTFYSLKLDKLQESIFDNAQQLIDVVKVTGNKEDYNKAEDYIKEIKTIPEEFLSVDTSKLIKELEETLSRAKNRALVDKIINMAPIKLEPNDENASDNSKTSSKTTDSKKEKDKDDKEDADKTNSKKLSITLPVAVPEDYDLYVTFDWINEVTKKSPKLEDIKNSYAVTKVQGDGKTKTVNMPLVKDKNNKELPLQGKYLIYMVHKKTSKVDFVGKNPITIDLGVRSSTTNSKNQSTLTIDSGAKYSGYITHEIKAKYKNRFIKHDVLIEKGDTPQMIANKINKSFEGISSAYMVKTTMKIKNSELVIETGESKEITHRIQ